MMIVVLGTCPTVEIKRSRKVEKPHDRGGWDITDPIDQGEHPVMDWERRLAALGRVLPLGRFMSTDVSRRGIESIPLDQYSTMAYWERRLVGMETRLVDQGLLTAEEIDQKAAELEAGWSVLDEQIDLP